MPPLEEPLEDPAMPPDGRPPCMPFGKGFDPGASRTAGRTGTSLVIASPFGSSFQGISPRSGSLAGDTC